MSLPDDQDAKRALKADKAKAENLDKLFNLVSIVKDAGEFSVHNIFLIADKSEETHLF